MWCCKENNGDDCSVAATSAETRDDRGEVYLKFCIGQNTRMCLPDSGADVALVPTSVARHFPVEPVACRMTTTDGRTFDATGCVVQAVTVGLQKMVNDGLVSDHVAEITPGEEELQNDRVLWDHHRQRVKVNGVWHKLCTRYATGSSRQVCMSLCREGSMVVEPQHVRV